MSVIKEHYITRSDGTELYRTYSDRGVYIRKVGTEEIYSEAVDIADAPYEYEETDTAIEKYSDPYHATESDYIAALNELGVEV